MVIPITNIAGESNFFDEPSPQLKLVGNYFDESVTGDIFPELTTPTSQFECLGKTVFNFGNCCNNFTTCIAWAFLVQGNACFSTKGRGRMFIPLDILEELYQGAPKTKPKTFTKYEQLPVYHGYHVRSSNPFHLMPSLK